MTRLEDEHLKRCKAGHFRTKPFDGSEKKLLVCKKTGQYVDRQALRDEIERFYEKKHGIGG